MKYWAFISYSHTDKQWGDWLHKELETYRVPQRLVGRASRDGTVPPRLYPIFRDREELPVSSDLSSNINEALRESRYLIVVCSPRAASSRWVGEAASEEAKGRYQQVDADLNAVYERSLATLSPEAKAALREAQRAWIAYRDANGPFGLEFLAGITVRRADQLSEFYVGSTTAPAAANRLRKTDAPPPDPFERAR